MKKLGTIFFLLIMVFQAVPLLHFFTDEQQVVCATGEEESTTLKCKEVKGTVWDESCFLSSGTPGFFAAFLTQRFYNHSTMLPPNPYAERPAPPPDYC